jgi:hypothetical protein
MGRAINSFTSWVGTPHTIGGQNRLPETNLARAVLSRAFLDSMGYLNPQSSHGRGELSQLKNSARKFISAKKKIFREWCDIADADPDYVAELYDDLTYHMNSGKLKNLRIKVIIEKLVDRI